MPKLFPLVVVPVLAAIRWREGRRDEARHLVAVSALTFVSVNVPVAVFAPHGWWWTFGFQSGRQATWGSAWFYVLRASGLPVSGTSGARLANLLGAAALICGIVWLVRRVHHGTLDPYAAGAAAVAIFILSNKVYSPTYDLWLVVFFVMVPFSRRLWRSFCAVDAVVFVTVYGYFHHLQSLEVVHVVLPALVVVRTAILLAVVVVATRTRPPERVGLPWSPAAVTSRPTG